MSIDTRAKRHNATFARRLPWMRRFTVPLPDGDIDFRTRAQLAGHYMPDAGLFPADATFSRAGVADTTFTRSGPADISMSRSGPSSGSLTRRTS